MVHKPSSLHPATPGPLAAPPQFTIEQAWQQAERHYAAGQLQHAEILLRQILQLRPNHAHALHLSGVIAHQMNNTEQAIQLIRQAIINLPTAGQFHSNLGEMCRLLKRWDEAVAHGEQAVALDPHSAIAHSNLGIAYYDRKELDQAEACQQRALALNPKLVTALNNMGSIRRDRKDKHGAIDFYRQVLALAPQHPESLNNLGAVLTETEQPEEAIKFLLTAIQVSPGYAEAHCNIATAFLSLEKFDQAVAGFQRALALKPDYVEAYQGLARLYQEQSKLQEAEALAHQALALDASKAGVHSLLGGIYGEAGFADKAHQAYAQALQLEPDLLGAHLGQGHLFMEQGKLDEAEASFRHVLHLDTDNLGARLSLAQVKKAKPDDGNMAALIAAAEQLDPQMETKALPLHFALGKCYDDTGQYDLAFAHYLQGCRLKRKRIHYNAAENEQMCHNIREFFSRQKIDSLRSSACPSTLPIFILGMPRSGTTLTEQIIASHPQVYGAGELHDLLQLANHPRAEASAGYPWSLANITPTELTALGEQYVSGLQARQPGAQYITDKMPANFNCVGLIHLMLPHAKIIHVQRNPVDTCLSCFTRLFNKSQNQSYDLREIGDYYRNYAQLMEHWRSVLPAGSFYEVQYENLVTDNENQARALLQYCGLEWHDACLESHKTERNIRTASVTQVRQPIYHSSLERWRKYEAHLGPLLEALGDLVR
ncbi:MAG: tetratricopeptide repeat protein [Gallionellaceae bacterium]|nr:tetratricopeptide repeat protein [Gallionellaceae bacterium]